jgi:hypothetical protein
MAKGTLQKAAYCVNAPLDLHVEETQVHLMTKNPFKNQYLGDKCPTLH